MGLSKLSAAAPKRANHGIGYGIEVDDPTTTRYSHGTASLPRFMPATPAIPIIINASSGSGDKKELTDKLSEGFRSQGVDALITMAEGGAQAIEAARRALHEGSRKIVAGGGDGTINAIASMLVGTDATLGILPLGTLNHFAKDLGIPLDLEEATRTIIAGRVMQVDIGEVNERIFLNNSSLGLYPHLVRYREKQQEQLRRGKWPAFFWAVLRVLHRYPFVSVRLSANGQQLIRRTPFVFIGNNEYEMESFKIGQRRCLNAGQLSIYMSRRVGRLGLARLAFSALAGRLREAKDFDALCTKEIWIETPRKRLHVAIDGEVTLMNSPLHYRIRPGALRVMAPNLEPPKAVAKVP